METLHSGLPELIADEEDLARFLTSSSQYNAKMVKPSVFLPEPKDRETSVFRHGSEPRANLWALGIEYAVQGRNLHGAAIIKAHQARSAALEAIADEPPSRHGTLRNWPWNENDPELQKAMQKDRANLLASIAELIRR